MNELQQRITAYEFSELVAFSEYFQPLDDSWRQAAMIACCAFNPHVSKTDKLKMEKLVPTRRIPKDYDPSADIALLNSIFPLPKE